MTTIIKPDQVKPCLWGFRPGKTQTRWAPLTFSVITSWSSHRYGFEPCLGHMSGKPSSACGWGRRGGAGRGGGGGVCSGGFSGDLQILPHLLMDSARK